MRKSFLVEFVGICLVVVGSSGLLGDILACLTHAPFSAEPFVEIAAWMLAALFMGLWLIELED